MSLWAREHQSLSLPAQGALTGLTAGRVIH
jgi:hypothetical protein